MARAFILGHGVRYPDAEFTFVPTGRSIAFYAEVDQRVLRVNGLAALNHGAIPPTETLTGPCQVPNYALRAFGDTAIAEHLASISSVSGGRPYFVGIDLPSPSYLCTEPDVCPKTHPQHADTCKGIFSLVAEPEILSVACRSVEGAEDKQSTYELGGSRDLDHELRAEAGRVLAWLNADPTPAVAYWETLTQATQSMLIHANIELRDALRAHYRGAGAATPAALVQARQYLDSYGAGAFYAWVATMPEDGPQRAMILADHALAVAFQAGWTGAQGYALDGHDGQGYGGLPARIGQQVAVLAEAVAAYTGTELDDATAAAQAYGALRADVHAYYTSVGGDAATPLYSACAEVGSALSAYHELPGEEALENLHAAVTALATQAVGLGGGL